MVKSSELEKELIFCEDITRLSSASVKKIDDGRRSIQTLDNRLTHINYKFMFKSGVFPLLRTRPWR